MKELRVRFAPSPTGGLHIGGVRTALYNYLLARRHGGTMILRIEDTDQARFVAGAEEYIQEALSWVGIAIDEGVGKGGPYAPYRQSERKSIYAHHVQELVNSGHAYFAFDSEAEIEQMRELLKQRGDAQQHYNSVSRVEMKNSLTLSTKQVEELVEKGTPHVVRLKVMPGEDIVLHDLIRGEVIVNSSQIDDKVLMKSDGMPTYHLANVVDDYLMKISHVIRGEEWLPSAPLHVLLYKYFGWTEDMPRFAHLPLLLKPDGQGKLSKRDADRMGFPIFPLNWTDPANGQLSNGFRESGYLPEAVINFLALLGWNPGTEQELFTIDQLAETFSLEKIHKAGSHFDIHKAQWFNQQYLHHKSDEELAGYLQTSLKSEGISCPPEKAKKVAAAMKERISFPKEIWTHGQFFFIAPTAFDMQTVSKKWNAEAVKALGAYADVVKSIQHLTAEVAKQKLEEVTSGLGIKTGQILQALRIAITGGSSGPDLMATLEIIGGEETAKRLKFAIETLPIK